VRQGQVFSLLVVAAVAVGCLGDRHVAALVGTPLAETATDGETSGQAPVDSAAPLPSSRDASEHVTPRRPDAFANVDPSDDLLVGPPDALPDCEGQLAHAGVTFRPASLPLHKDRNGKMLCGAPQVVTYLRGPGSISYDPPPVLTCGMALALASYERIVQEEAARVFSSPVTRIEQIGTYNCRGIVRFRGVISEHSYANAIDLTRFIFRNGKSVSVLGDFDKSDGPPTKPAGDFLRAISQRGEDEDIFSNVLTPFWDVAHKNHFHLDLARYRVEGARPLPTSPR
jgi:hypothetical protein